MRHPFTAIANSNSMTCHTSLNNSLSGKRPLREIVLCKINYLLLNYVISTNYFSSISFTANKTIPTSLFRIFVKNKTTTTLRSLAFSIEKDFIVLAFRYSSNHNRCCNNNTNILEIYA